MENFIAYSAIVLSVLSPVSWLIIYWSLSFHYSGIDYGDFGNRFHDWQSKQYGWGDFITAGCIIHAFFLSWLFGVLVGFGIAYLLNGYYELMIVGAVLGCVCFVMSIYLGYERKESKADEVFGVGARRHERPDLATRQH